MPTRLKQGSRRQVGPSYEKKGAGCQCRERGSRGRLVQGDVLPLAEAVSGKEGRQRDGLRVALVRRGDERVSQGRRSNRSSRGTACAATLPLPGRASVPAVAGIGARERGAADVKREYGRSHRAAEPGHVRGEGQAGSALLRPGDTGTNANRAPFTRCLLPALALREAKAKAPGEWQYNSIVPDQSSGLTIGTATAARRVAPMDGRHEPLLCPEGIGAGKGVCCRRQPVRGKQGQSRLRGHTAEREALAMPRISCTAPACLPAPRPAKIPLYVLPPRKPAPDYNGGRQAERAKAALPPLRVLSVLPRGADCRCHQPETDGILPNCPTMPLPPVPDGRQQLTDPAAAVVVALIEAVDVPDGRQQLTDPAIEYHQQLACRPPPSLI